MLLIRHLSVGALALALALTHSSGSVHAAPNGRTVTGTVALAPPASRRKAPLRGQGFVRRAKNPLRPPDGYDPRRRIVVVLRGGPVNDMDRKPRSSRYDIIGENFESDILPVVVGGKVEIKNLGLKSPRLYSKSNPNIVPGDPINKKGVRVTKAIETALVPIDIRDQDSVHFLADIVAFENSYFSVLDYRGKFKIEGVPAGNWKIKLWYDKGWVTNAPAASVNVAGKRDPKSITLTLPGKIATQAPAL